MQHYIVYMGNHAHPSSESVIKDNHHMLASVIGRHDVIHHHYTKSFRGFSAMLTADQAQRLAEEESVVSVFQSKINKVQTTHSWKFLKVDSIQQYNHLPIKVKSDVIVGVIDSGIWPESKSFSDHGLGPVPKKFKGKCVPGEMFTLANCNRQEEICDIRVDILIRARYYFKGFEAQVGPLESFNGTFFRSARDSDGHGTHVASIVAGSLVPDVSLIEAAKGTARGGVPSARLAIYRACWFDICTDADMLSALDYAIHDGVDVLSTAVGPQPPQPSYFHDAVSIGAFHAFQKGILVSASVGNGFFAQTATNVAPWILTVAASTMDREFQSNIGLGNSKIIKNAFLFQGFGLNPSNLEILISLFFLISVFLSFCQINSLDPNLVKGKIVVCTVEKITDNATQLGVYTRNIGGVGMILVEPLAQDLVFQFGTQATLIGQDELEEIQKYIATERNPVAAIYQTKTVLATKPAPEIAAFSSKGPNIITPDVIKPDIAAPGVNILAAWSPVALFFSGLHPVDYDVISGSSLAAAHVAAVAAIIKTSHPSWSPAAIKSAMMTTATVLDNTGNCIRRHPHDTCATPFDYGSGHVNPVAAIQPGLIYDLDSNDVIDFLCSYGATAAQLKNLTSQIFRCKSPSRPSYDFNYPSIGVSNMNGSLSVQRTVTYYGKGSTQYISKIEQPSGVHVTVTPSVLKFTNAGDKMSFTANFTPSKASNGSFVFGALTWSNAIHTVRSPIAVNVLSL
ncbi:unnamed protein product [Coffea canephora]|uniref:Subtilisin-like protease fibronectin type-III domain-containing protein n=1 Tax=Coffea canephora TaxID=49390 RepID=A0A068UF71_COFCA|nr:unnamed protein product [Coffea canephora]